LAKTPTWFATCVPGRAKVLAPVPKNWDGRRSYTYLNSHCSLATPMIEIAESIWIPDIELQWSFVRASGPGGQNVNKVASKAVMRWNVLGSRSLPTDVRQRLLARFASRVTREGDIIVMSQRFRDQERNRQDCLTKLRDLIGQVAQEPHKRKTTRPTRGSKERRLTAKKRRSALKSVRKKLHHEA
jgi:ribosome-associated protein